MFRCFPWLRKKSIILFGSVPQTIPDESHLKGNGPNFQVPHELREKLPPRWYLWKSSWCFQICFYVHPYLGMIFNLTNIFSNGLKPPTRKDVKILGFLFPKGKWFESGNPRNFKVFGGSWDLDFDSARFIVMIKLNIYIYIFFMCITYILLIVGSVMYTTIIHSEFNIFPCEMHCSYLFPVYITIIILYLLLISHVV